MKFLKFKNSIKKVVRIVISVGLLMLMLVSLAFTTKEQKALKCTKIDVEISNNGQFIDVEEVQGLFKKQLNYINGARLDTINSDEIENLLELHPWIANAEVFMGYCQSDSALFDGKLSIKIVEKSPIARYVNGDTGFYIGEKGEALPIIKHKSFKTLIITSDTDNFKVKSNLLPFIRFINNDEFWKAQIVQIHLLKNDEIILIPRVGEHKIEFGLPINIEQKFNNLMTVYQKGFTVTGWNQYKTINLKFSNQVICAK